MGLAVTIARRSLLGRPGRTFFSVLGVALGIATVVAVFTVDHVTVLSRTLSFAGDATAGADLEVRPSGRIEDPRRELLEMEGVAGVAAYFQNDVAFRPAPRPGGAPSDDLARAVSLIALEADAAPSLGVYHVERGRHLDPAGRTREALVGAELARAHGLEPGSIVYLAPPRRAAREACVEGRLQVLPGGEEQQWSETPFEVVGVLAREGVGRASKGRVVLVDYAVGRGLYEDLFIEPRFWIARDETVDLEVLESSLSRGFSFERNRGATVGQAADERAFRNGVRVAGLFALLLGLFVIFHTLSMSLIERVGEIGSLHTLGAGRGQIARVFFAEALCIAVTAGVLGFAGGLALARAMLRAGITTLGVGGPVRIFEVPWRASLSLTFLGVGIALVGSVFPILTARGADVVAVLRGEDVARRSSMTRGFHVFVLVALILLLPAVFFAVVPVVGAAGATLVRTVVVGLGVVALLLGLALLLPSVLGRACALLARPFAGRWPLAAQLAARSLTQAPARVGASIAALALVTSAFVALRGMTNSLRAEIEVWAESAIADKVFVEGLQGRPVALVMEQLRDVPEIVGYEPGDLRAYVGFRLVGAAPEGLAGYGPCLDPETRRAFAEEQTILLSERLARQVGRGVGDLVQIRTSGHGVQEFRVLAVSDAYGYFMNPDERAYGVVAARHLQRFFCLDPEKADSLALRLSPGADPDAVAEVVWKTLARPRLQLTTGASVLQLHLEDISRDFVVFDVILLLSACLAGLGVLNGQLLAALERRKELGVLRALGMTRGQLTGAVLLESGILGLAGGLLGILVGTALTPVLVVSLRVLSGLALPLRLAGPAMAAFLVGALLLAVLAGLYPIWRMNRLDPVRAVRTG